MIEISRWIGRMAAAVVMCAAATGAARAEVKAADVLATYADIARAGYEDSLTTAKAPQGAVDALLANPSEATLAAARAAWIAARVPYQQTEAFRFGNPIVDEWEGKVNAWPLDEGLIDYVDRGFYGTVSDSNPLYTANVIADKTLKVGGRTVDASKITAEFLSDVLQEAEKIEANVATGYHVVEFLLWGPDVNDTEKGAGARIGDGLALASLVPSGALVDREQLFAAARRTPDGSFSAAIFRVDGTDVRSVALPGRGHDLTLCPETRRCVVFASRPGNFAIAFSRDAREAPVLFTTPTGRHFYGHGVFARDCRILYATENDFGAGVGVIGFYDATDGFRRIGEIPSHGIGPHDMALSRDGRMLVIANGGIKEHPDVGGGRVPLNPGSYEASLAYVDVPTGDLVERHALGAELGHVSLRHLDVGAGGAVVIGCQAAKGPRDAETPLVYRHRLGTPLARIALPEPTALALDNCVSSVAVDRAGEFAAITSSHEGVVVFLDIATGRVLREARHRDVSGVAPSATAHGFLVTTGMGQVIAREHADRGPCSNAHADCNGTTMRSASDAELGRLTAPTLTPALSAPRRPRSLQSSRRRLLKAAPVREHVARDKAAFLHIVTWTGLRPMPFSRSCSGASRSMYPRA